MDEALKFLGAHAPQSLGLALAIWLAWKIVQLFFWSEKRVERIAAQVLTSDTVRKAMREVAETVFQSLAERDREARIALEGRMTAIEDRDVERADSVKRAHQRIDTVTDKVGEVYAMVAGLHR